MDLYLVDCCTFGSYEMPLQQLWILRDALAAALVSDISVCGFKGTKSEPEAKAVLTAANRISEKAAALTEAEDLRRQSKALRRQLEDAEKNRRKTAAAVQAAGYDFVPDILRLQVGSLTGFQICI